jgi:hypothetical protein
LAEKKKNSREEKASDSRSRLSSKEKKRLITKGLLACFVAVTGDSKQASHHKTRRKCVRFGMCPWCLSTSGVLPFLLPITTACVNFLHSDSRSLFVQ